SARAIGARVGRPPTGRASGSAETLDRSRGRSRARASRSWTCADCRSAGRAGTVETPHAALYGRSSIQTAPTTSGADRSTPARWREAPHRSVLNLDGQYNPSQADLTK